MSLAVSGASYLRDKVFCSAIAVGHRRFEPHMIPVVSACDRSGVAVDVGAWYGPWTYWLSRRVETVVAFEPNPSVASVLRRCVRPNVEVRQLAVSDQASTVNLVVIGTRAGEEGRSYIDTTGTARGTVEVEATTLDAQGLERVRLVKIDVEGHELATLRGGVALLERCHPILVVELEARYGDVRPVFDLLSSLGYRGRALVGGQWKPMGPYELADLQQRHAAPSGGYLRSVLRRGNGYVNNIVFAHPRSTWVPW